MFTVYLVILQHPHGDYSAKTFRNFDAAFDWADCMAEPVDEVTINPRDFADADVATEFYEAF